MLVMAEVTLLMLSVFCSRGHLVGELLYLGLQLDQFAVDGKRRSRPDQASGQNHKENTAAKSFHGSS